MEFKERIICLQYLLKIEPCKFTFRSLDTKCSMNCHLFTFPVFFVKVFLCLNVKIPKIVHSKNPEICMAVDLLSNQSSLGVNTYFLAWDEMQTFASYYYLISLDILLFLVFYNPLICFGLIVRCPPPLISCNINRNYREK